MNINLNRKPVDELQEMEETGPSLREAVLEEKRKKGREETEKKSGGQPAEGMNPVTLGTSKLLQLSWENLVTSFGLTLIWINAHVFLRQIFPKFFCKLGEEWSSKLPEGSSGLGKVGSEGSNELGKALGSKVSLAEEVVLGAIDVGCFLIILLIIGIVGLILGVIDNPMKAIYEALSYIIGNFWAKWL